MWAEKEMGGGLTFGVEDSGSAVLDAPASVLEKLFTHAPSIPSSIGSTWEVGSSLELAEEFEVEAEDGVDAGTVCLGEALHIAL